MILSINLPEFTQIVLLMNWRNKSCKFVKKIVESISKRINCKRDTPHKWRSTLLIGHSTTNLQVDKIWHFRDSSCQHSFILGLLYNDHFDKVGAQGDWCNQLKLQNLIKFVSSGLYNNSLIACFLSSYMSRLNNTYLKDLGLKIGGNFSKFLLM